MKPGIVKLGIGLASGWVLILALGGCGESSSTEATLDTEQASLVAALAANEDGSDEAWTSAGGAEPFVVLSCGFDQIVAQVVERFDSDGSGDLNEEERANVAAEFGDPSERLQLLLSAYDSDDSGSLEAAELDVLKADLEARCEARKAQLIEQFDTDGDGTLDDAERAAVRAALGARFGARHGARVREFDRNGDGRLGRGELLRVGAAIGERIRERREDIEASFDEDGDGTLDATEQAALKEHLRDCVRGERPLAPNDDPVPADPVVDTDGAEAPI